MAARKKTAKKTSKRARKASVETPWFVLLDEHERRGPMTQARAESEAKRLGGKAYSL